MDLFSGMGTSVIEISATTAISKSFSGSQKLLALSIQSTGMSVGGALTPYLFNYLMKTYGLNGNFLLMGGIFLNCLPAAVLFSISSDNLVNKMKKEPQQKDKAYTETKTVNHNFFPVLHQKMKNLKRDLHETMSPTFVIIVLAVGFTLAPIGGFYSLLLDILKWTGFTSDEALLGFPVTYGVGCNARLIPGISKQFKVVSSFLCLIIFSLCGACGQLIFLSFSGNLILLIGCGLTGIASARITSGGYVIVAQILGQEQIALGVGLMYSTLGILATVYGPTYGMF